MEMPRSIKMFERLFFGSLLLGMLHSVLTLDEFSNEIALLGNAEVVGGIIVIWTIITVAIVLLTSRKKSVICKWILTILFFLGVVSVVFEQGIIEFLTEIEFLTGIVWCMQTYAVYLLFDADSKEWFASKNT